MDAAEQSESAAGGFSVVETAVPCTDCFATAAAARALLLVLQSHLYG